MNTIQRAAHVLVGVLVTAFGCGHAPVVLQSAPPGLAGQTILVEEPRLYVVGKDGARPADMGGVKWRAELTRALESSLLNAGYRIAINSSVKHQVTLRTTWRWKKSWGYPSASCGAYEAMLIFELPRNQRTSAFVADDSNLCENLEELAKLAVNHLTSNPRFRQVATIQESIPDDEPPFKRDVASQTADDSDGETDAPDERSSTPTQPDSYAVVVGVQTYQDGLPASDGAKADAEGFKLMAKNALGIPDSQIRSLIEDKATKASVDRALDWAANSVPKGGRIYFYFAGHGAPDAVAGEPFLVPRDGDPTYLQATAIPLGQVMAKLGKSQAREVFVFLDSCFSGTGDRSVLPKGTRPLVLVKDVALPTRVALYASSASNETSGAMPGQGHGVFTHFLLEGLGKGLADLDGDGQVSLKELDAWVSPRVSREARKQNRSQTPTVKLGHGLGTSEDVVVRSGLP